MHYVVKVTMKCYSCLKTFDLDNAQCDEDNHEMLLLHQNFCFGHYLPCTIW